MIDPFIRHFGPDTTLVRYKDQALPLDKKYSSERKDKKSVGKVVVSRLKCVSEQEADASDNITVSLHLVFDLDLRTAHILSIELPIISSQ